jgi:hypothetical protein
MLSLQDTSWVFPMEMNGGKKKEKKSISHFHVYILISSQGIAYEIISEIDTKRSSNHWRTYNN